MTTESIDELEDRVAKGIAWLTEHDPTGAFHFWFEARIHPRSTMPAQDETTRAAYAEYHQARTLWEELFARLQRRQAKEAS